MAQYQRLEDEGKIPKYEPQTPPDDERLPSARETMEDPEFLTALKQDPEQAFATTLSKSMWSKVCPGYMVRDGPRLASAMQSDYIWDEEEIAYMKEQGEFDKTNNRRRDDFVQYAEALARATKLARAK